MIAIVPAIEAKENNQHFQEPAQNKNLLTVNNKRKYSSIYRKIIMDDSIQKSNSDKSAIRKDAEVVKNGIAVKFNKESL